MTALLIGVVVITTTVGDLLVTYGMKQTGEVRVLSPAALWRRMGRALANASIIGGVACMTISFFAFLAALARAPVSLVVPATAATYVASTLGAKWFLGERVSAVRWLGTLIVLSGVVLISIG